MRRVVPHGADIVHDLHEIISRPNAIGPAGLDDTDEQIADRRALFGPKKQGILPMQHDPLQGPLDGIMPPPGLCRAETAPRLGCRRISDSGTSLTRHNQRPSRNASSESVGL